MNYVGIALGCLVDTGADISVVPIWTVKVLALPAVDEVLVRGVG